MEPIFEKMQEFKRDAWKPVTEDRDGDLTVSKFSGRPWLAENEAWPKCGNCGKEMQLFVQLNLDQLPSELGDKFGSGLLQMFYCTNGEQECEVEAEAWAPFSKSTLLRVINPLAQKVASNIEIPSPEIIPDYFPAKVITDWIQKEDYPNWEEADQLDLELTGEENDALGNAGFPLSKDKLAGWPYWIQGVEYPNCPVCGEQMRLLFQIDSYDHLSWMWGDSGCGHITQCENHLNQVAFGWACG